MYKELSQAELSSHRQKTSVSEFCKVRMVFRCSHLSLFLEGVSYFIGGGDFCIRGYIRI